MLDSTQSMKHIVETRLKLPCFFNFLFIYLFIYLFCLFVKNFILRTPEIEPIGTSKRRWLMLTFAGQSDSTVGCSDLEEKNMCRVDIGNRMVTARPAATAFENGSPMYGYVCVCVCVCYYQGCKVGRQAW